MRRSALVFFALLATVVGDMRRTAAAEDQAAAAGGGEGDVALPNLRMRTFGGLQYWGDELISCDWRIQRNCFTGHCRLLDDKNRRRAWGAFAACRDALDAARRKEGLVPIRGRVVLVLHGLAGARPLATGMCRHLAEQGKLHAVAIGYPSTRVDIDADAKALSGIIAGLAEADRIDLVGHSLGCIVIRRYLAMNTDAANKKQPDPRIERIVMLTPPNQGVPHVENLVAWDVTGQIVGPAARQLSSGWKELEPKLVAPSGEFGILAGGRGGAEGYNPLVRGDNDGVVPVESTKLKGARDFRVVPALHPMFMNDESVQQLTLKFLEEGHFETDAKRTPL